MKDKVKQLVDEVELLDPQAEDLWEINWRKRFKLLTVDLSQTIEYLDECSENELSYATELLEELMGHFKSIELIACVERNIKRCKDEETIEYLKFELERMKNMQV